MERAGCVCFHIQTSEVLCNHMREMLQDNDLLLEQQALDLSCTPHGQRYWPYCIITCQSTRLVEVTPTLIGASSGYQSSWPLTSGRSLRRKLGAIVTGECRSLPRLLMDRFMVDSRYMRLKNDGEKQQRKPAHFCDNALPKHFKRL